MRYVIVGNGVAGTKAAETIRKRDAQGEIVIFSAEEVPFYRRPALVDYLLKGGSYEGLLGHARSFYERAGIDLHLGTAAIGLDPAGHRLTLAHGETLAYDRLLLAVGVSLPNGWLPGSDLAGVVTLRSLADVETLRKATARARRAAVLGEGVTGPEMLRAFRAAGLETTYLLEGARFWETVLSADASTIVEQRLRSEGVEVRPRQEVVGFEGADGQVRAVLTRDGGRIPVNVVGIAAGFLPPLEWAVAAGLQMGKRVPVDEFLATNLPDVYAAGDVIRMGDEARAFGWLRAWHQGTLAGINMTGGNVPYRKRTVSLSTRAFGLPILVLGETNPRGVHVRRVTGDYPQDGVHKEIVLDSAGQVIGALMVGEVSEASEVQDLVRKRVPYDQVAPELKRRLFDLRYWAAAGAEVLCPVCKFLVQVGEEELRQGRVTCPICGAEFVLRPAGNRLEAAL
jgi:NAD(P)H-nitrite reductase large subunit